MDGSIHYRLRRHPSHRGAAPGASGQRPPAALHRDHLEARLSPDCSQAQRGGRGAGAACGPRIRRAGQLQAGRAGEHGAGEPGPGSTGPGSTGKWKVGAQAVPYVVGQWVRGDLFYGRAAQIAEILDGNRNWLWLLGTRRVGKTSLLKQLEYLTSNSPTRGYFPIFWDFQGAEHPEELHQDFSDALLDAEERLERLGIDLADVAADDLFASLGRLRRKLRSKDLRLLLLCDEVEELIQLGRKDPALLRKLRRAMQSREGIRSVLASSIRLWALAEQKEDTSPFLHGFTPPVYLDILRDDEARALIRQTQMTAETRPRFDDQAVERIRERCGNHPYLIQMVGSRYVELGDLDEAFEEVATDAMVSYFFSVDFELLSAPERKIIYSIAERTAASSKTIQHELPLDSPSLIGSLNRLEHLGFIRRNDDRRFYLVNAFFRRWLGNLPLTRPLSDGLKPKMLPPG